MEVEFLDTETGEQTEFRDVEALGLFVLPSEPGAVYIRHLLVAAHRLTSDPISRDMDADEPVIIKQFKLVEVPVVEKGGA